MIIVIYIIVVIAIISCTLFFIVRKQLKIKEHFTDSGRFIFYLTGDGGYSKATKKLCSLFQKYNYNIIALDTRYFWGGRTLKQATDAFENDFSLIESKRKMERITVIGYSFGADITPFIINNISDGIRNKISEVVLLSPSRRTDLKIGLGSLLFPKYSGKLNVAAEINKIKIPVKVILNEMDSLSKADFKDDITINNLPGNHHFDYNYELLVKTILKSINDI